MNTVSIPPPLWVTSPALINTTGEILLVHHLTPLRRTDLNYQLTNFLQLPRIGWGSLVVAGAGAYFFAKREIDADRRQKHAERQRKQCTTHAATWG